MPIRPRNKPTPAPVVQPVAADEPELPLPEPTTPMTPTVQQDEGVLMVRRCNYANGVILTESTDEQRVPTPKFEGEVARTRVTLGVTKSLGGFEFARIDVMVELPCNPNPTDLQETNEFASQQATEFMNRELAGVMPVPRAPQTTNMSALTHG